MTSNRTLRVFLCHSRRDKEIIRELYQKLRAEPWIEPWLDEEELFPGMDWNFEIEKAIEATDVILVCLSNNSITKAGYVQREIRIALDYADCKPEGTLFIIPVRLEECVPPKRLARWQYADYFTGQLDRGFERLFMSLKRQAELFGVKYESPESAKLIEEDKSGFEYLKKLLVETSFTDDNNLITGDELSLANINSLFHPVSSNNPENKDYTLSNSMELVHIPAGNFLMGSNQENQLAYGDEYPQHIVDIPYDYWMARFPITNDQFNSYINAKGSAYPMPGWERKKRHPVVNVTWIDAVMYCRWLNNKLKSEFPKNLILRLPTEAEWEKAARGIDGRKYPWGSAFDKNKLNINKDGTTLVGLHSPNGDSFYRCTDMIGNVWEWTHSLKKVYPYNFTDGRENEKKSGHRIIRGGSFDCDKESVYCACKDCAYSTDFDEDIGFRICLAPALPK